MCGGAWGWEGGGEDGGEGGGSGGREEGRGEGRREEGEEVTLDQAWERGSQHHTSGESEYYAVLRSSACEFGIKTILNDWHK